MRDEKVMPVISYAMSRVGSSVSVPIVMVITPPAPFPERSAVAFGGSQGVIIML